jgi:tRNA-binding protein
MKAQIEFGDFEKIDIRVGKILSAEQFPEARKPAYKLSIDFGEEVGVKNSSAQITTNYVITDLIGREIVAVINFPPKRIASFVSEVLVLGVADEQGAVVLLQPSGEIAPGSSIY